MKIIVSGKHLELTEAIKEYAIEKSSKIEKIIENIQEVHVQLEVEKTKSEGELHKATSTIHLPGKTIRVEAEGKDLYAVIDELEDKSVRQVRKYKEKMQDKSIK